MCNFLVFVSPRRSAVYDKGLNWQLTVVDISTSTSTDPVWVLVWVRVGLPLELDLARGLVRPHAQVLHRQRPRRHVTSRRPRGHRTGHCLHHHLAQRKIFVKIQKYFPGQVTWYVLPGTRFSVKRAVRGPPRSTNRGFLRRMSMATWYLEINQLWNLSNPLIPMCMIRFLIVYEPKYLEDFSTALLDGREM